MSARTLQRLENGHAPSLDSLKALAAALEMPLADLRAPITNAGEATPMANDTARHRLRRHLTAYVVVMAGLAALNLVRNPDHLWFLYPLLGWGVPLAVQALRFARRPA